MGNLVDTYIIAPKKIGDKRTENEESLIAFFDLPLAGDEGQFGFEIAKSMLPIRWHRMLTHIAKYAHRHYMSIHQFMELDDQAVKALHAIEKIFGADMSTFDHRFRGECFRQVMRRTFYDTLLIVENDIDPEKTNRYIVLRSSQIITEDDLKGPSEDEKGVNSVAKFFNEKGYDVRTIDGKNFPSDS